MTEESNQRDGVHCTCIDVEDEDFRKTLSDCMSVLESKGKDYTLGNRDRLHNFRTVAEFTGQTPESVLGVYLYKHMAAVFAYVKSGGQSESEPIQGRIVDAINYLLLLSKMVEEKGTPNTRPSVTAMPGPGRFVNQNEIIGAAAVLVQRLEHELIGLDGIFEKKGIGVG